MTKKVIKEETKEEVAETVKSESKSPKVKSEFENLLEIYKAQSPTKYALKKAELERKLEANK